MYKKYEVYLKIIIKKYKKKKYILLLLKYNVRKMKQKRNNSILNKIKKIF